jgi:hypothetical protein
VWDGKAVQLATKSDTRFWISSKPSSLQTDESETHRIRSVVDSIIALAKTLHSASPLLHLAQRSQTIADYVASNGVPSDGMLLVAADGITDDGRSMNSENRRVAIRLFTVANSG